MKLSEIHQDILCLALCRYLMINNLTPYDAIVANSKPENKAHQWTSLLVSLLSGNYDTFKREDMLKADPVKHPATFRNQIESFQERTVKVATVAGMLCQMWTTKTVEPYASNKSLHESHDYVSSILNKLC